MLGCLASKLPESIVNNFPQTPLQAVPRKWFNEAKGYASFESLGSTSKDHIQILKNRRLQQEKYYAFSALNALLTFISENESIHLARKSILFKVVETDGTMLLDGNIPVKLNLITGVDPKKQDSLLAALNYTITRMGQRLLKMSILQPLTDALTITKRLDVVEFLTSSSQEDLLYKIEKHLKCFAYVVADADSTSLTLDLDNIIAQLMKIPKKPTVDSCESRIYNLILLRKALTAVLSLAELFLGVECPELLEIALENIDVAHIQEIITYLDDVLVSEQDFMSSKVDAKLINKTFTNPVGRKHVRSFAVKPGLNSFLDVARATYREGLEDIQELASAWSTQLNTPVTVQFLSTKMFCFSISAKARGTDVKTLAASLPKACMNVQVSGQFKVTFTTLDLLKLNERIKESQNEIYILSDKECFNAVEFVREKTHIIYSASESIAVIDLLFSFANYAIVNSAGTLIKCFVKVH